MTPNKVLVLFTILFPVVHNKINCPKGFFILEGMTQCHPYLSCTDLNDVKLIRKIGHGAVKNVYLARWKDYLVAFSTLRNNLFVEDFKEGLKLFKLFTPSIFITRLVGYCETKNILITEFHELNNANSQSIRQIVDKSPVMGLKLCLNYARILNFIHSRHGVRVNCDSNSLQKTLSQILITKKWKLVLNDLDALPIRGVNSSVVCGSGDMTRFDRELSPPEYYSRGECTEQCDVWKVPDVCNYFLGGSHYSVLQYSVFGVHSKCKETDPAKRPSSSDLVKLYKSLL